MKNPLRKRYLRELKSDFGKYLAIALFMIMLIGLVSGYFVAAGSIEKTFYEGWDKYNIEDGHVTFSKEPDPAVLAQIEKEAGLEFYNLEYTEEDIDDRGTTLRIFKDRKEINKECLMEGAMPEAENEIAIDRVFAENNAIKIGDTITVAGKKTTVTGYIALVDYNCLFENNNDMMFNADIFGVAVMTDVGYEELESSHVFWCYAWKYNDSPRDDYEENARFENLTDVIEDVMKDYDTELVQAEVNEIYHRANGLSEWRDCKAIFGYDGHCGCIFFTNHYAACRWNSEITIRKVFIQRNIGLSSIYSRKNLLFIYIYHWYCLLWHCSGMYVL